jgi:DNA-binding MarR family transcriptional regulator
MAALKDPRRHDDLLNYRLKRLFAAGGAPAVRLCEGGYGIARQEWRLVAALVEDGPMSPGALARRSRVELARVSRVAGTLVRKGLASRQPVSGGAAQLAATVRAEALYRELLPQLAAINRRIMEVLDEREALLLENFLDRLQERADALEAAAPHALKADRYRGTGHREAERRW